MLPCAGQNREVLAPRAGYIHAIDTRAVGQCGILLGAGRAKKEDAIDYGAGIVFHKKIGDRVEMKEPLALLYHNDPAGLDEAKERLVQAITIADGRPKRPPLVYL
jgi:pyrimidine-nucleoside phosphorylase